MSKWWIAAAIVGVISGCNSANKPQADGQPIDVNSDSIAEAPQAGIKSETYLAAGDLAASRGQAEKAAAQYEKAAKATPNDPAVLKKLAMAYVNAGQRPQAIETWQQHLAATKGADESYGSLGYAYELAGDPTSAEKTYRDGIARNPKGPLSRINYGLMLVRNSRVEEAVTQMSTVLQPHEVNYNVASVYEQMGRKDLATFYFRRSLECKADFRPALQKLSMAK
ncbi:MAG TPA: tetratricopeptide repeat protein [Tepidisphaeraceae bacterium]|jgi:Tfp pilus assembly protein PilF